MAITDEKFVSVSTFRKSGAEVTTTTWIIPLDGGKVGFWTSSASGKAKRLRNDPRLTIQPSDSRGRTKPGSEQMTGTATLADSGPEFDEVQAKIRAKYGMMVPISRMFNKIGHIGKGSFPYGDLAVVVTVD
ncbi:pyridoxamine 5'-phosphate oxidase family protein [Jatrophihabitans sp. DSM 45814]